MSESDNIIVEHTAAMTRHFCWLVNEYNRVQFSKEIYRQGVVTTAGELRAWLKRCESSGLNLRSVMRVVTTGFAE